MGAEDMLVALDGATYRGTAGGWVFAAQPWAILMERTDDPDTARDAGAGVARVAAELSCEHDASAAALVAFAMKHGGALVECDACDGNGSVKCACSQCDVVHDAPCADCKGKGEKTSGALAFVAVHGVSVPAWKLAAVLRWFIGRNVTDVRVGTHPAKHHAMLAIAAGNLRAVVAARHSMNEPAWPVVTP